MCELNNLDECYKIAEELVLYAGKIIEDGINSRKNIKSKGIDWDLVTEYDRKIEDILIKQLLIQFPSHKFIGEETVAKEGCLPQLTDDPTWIIDPIDEIRAVRHRSSFIAVSTVNRSVVPTRFSTTAIMSSDLDIAKCFEFAKELTLQAGQILECSFKDELVVYDKGKDDFVTNYDYKIEKILIDGLSKEFPDHKIIAEETTEMEKMPELTDTPTWFIDPIDGTHNFMHLFPHFCISVGLMVCKELVLGIIYNPSNSELYTAIKGKGAFLNGKPIHTSNVTELKKTLIILEPFVLKIKTKDTDIQKARMDALIEVTHITRCIGSAALALAYVARGIADCFHLDIRLKPWDVAAGTLILREAGGTVLDTKGGAYDIMKARTIAASNETLAREISKFIIDIDLKTQRKRLHREPDAKQ